MKSLDSSASLGMTSDSTKILKLTTFDSKSFRELFYGRSLYINLHYPSNSAQGPFIAKVSPLSWMFTNKVFPEGEKVRPANSDLE